MKKTIIVATRNAHKAQEIAAILPDGYEVRTLADYPEAPEVEETADTFAGNAALKSCGISALLPGMVLADDSGLCVDALGGAPGVYSARYGGEGLDDKGRYELLLKNMVGVENRNARFVSCIAVVFPNGDKITAEGTCEGSVMHAPAGDGGFGYDPIFFCESFGKSMAELTHEEKNSISHRGNALRKFAPLLREYLEKEDR